MAHKITDLCIACGVCEDECPEKAIKEDEVSEIFTIIETLCTDCGNCVKVCPVDAIKPKK